MVQNVGLEPTRPNEHSDLNAACLPFQQFCILTAGLFRAAVPRKWREGWDLNPQHRG